MALGAGGRGDFGGWVFRPIASKDTLSLVPCYEEPAVPSLCSGRKEQFGSAGKGHIQGTVRGGIGIMPITARSDASVIIIILVDKSCMILPCLPPPTQYGISTSYWRN